MGIAERVRFPQFHNRIMDAAAAAALIPHGATVGMSGCEIVESARAQRYP
jgi:succinyl-CoA:acetate CoA-transferase